MSTATERLLNSKTVSHVIKLCSNGNEDAEAYLSNVAYAARIVDDLIDKDHPVSNDEICRAFFILFAEIPSNAFYLEHMETLSGLHITAFNAWMDSNEWIKKEGVKLRYAMVLRDLINELLPLVTYITGGYKSMREASLQVRELFLKETV